MKTKTLDNIDYHITYCQKQNKSNDNRTTYNFLIEVLNQVKDAYTKEHCPSSDDKKEHTDAEEFYHKGDYVFTELSDIGLAVKFGEIFRFADEYYNINRAKYYMNLPKKVTVSQMRKWEKEIINGEISYGKMLENINEIIDASVKYLMSEANTKIESLTNIITENISTGEKNRDEIQKLREAFKVTKGALYQISHVLPEKINNNYKNHAELMEELADEALKNEAVIYLSKEKTDKTTKELVIDKVDNMEKRLGKIIGTIPLSEHAQLLDQNEKLKEVVERLLVAGESNSPTTWIEAKHETEDFLKSLKR